MSPSGLAHEVPPPDLEALAEDHYFTTNPPPKDLPKHEALARDFINFHAAAGRRLVLITSGGTTVPLGKFLLFIITLLFFHIMTTMCSLGVSRKRKTNRPVYRQFFRWYSRRCKLICPVPWVSLGNDR